jgi:hypothetical protein
MSEKAENIMRASLRKHGAHQLKLITFCLLFAITYLPSIGLAATYYLDPVNGDNSNPGTEAEPWADLASVLETKYHNPITDGDVLKCYTGYHGVLDDAQLDWRQNTDYIICEAAEGHDPCLGYIEGYDIAYWKFKGFKISTDYIPEGPEYDRDLCYFRDDNDEDAGHVTIENCQIWGTINDTNDYNDSDWQRLQYSSGILFSGEGGYNHAINNDIRYVDASAIATNSNSNVIGNTIVGFLCDAVHIHGDNIVVEDNYIADPIYWQNLQGEYAHHDGIQCSQGGFITYGNWSICTNKILQKSNPPVAEGDAGLQGVYVNLTDPNAYVHDVNCKNNLIVTGNSWALRLEDARDCYVINNIVIPPSGSSGTPSITEHYDGQDPNNFVIRNNIASNWSTGDGVVASNNMDFDDYAPNDLFVNYQNGNYMHRVGSAAIDTGTSMDAPATDLLKNTRPQGGGYDVGCYEYVPVDANQEFAFEPIGDKEVDEGSNLTFEVVTNDPNTKVSLEDHNLPSEPNFTENNFSWTPTYDDAGSYLTTFLAPNGEFLDCETITITVNNVNRKPLIEPITDKTVDENSPVIFSVNATDPDGDDIIYAADNLPTGSVFAGHTFGWTPGYNQAGNYILSFVATDGELEDSETVIITVNNINRNPVLNEIGNKSIDANDSLTFAISAVDPDSDTITYSAQNLHVGATFTNPKFSWTPGPDQAGSYQVTFIASDGQSTDSETITIIVNNKTNTAPILTGISEVDEGETLSFAVNATDPDGDVITYSAQNLPTGAVLSGNSFTWTPESDQAGSYEVTLIVSDGQLEDSQTVTITVTVTTNNRRWFWRRRNHHSETVNVTISNINIAPVLEEIGNKSVNENETLKFTIQADDPDGDAITYSAESLPAGAAFAGNAFTWTPGSEQAGSYQVVFIASDGQATDSETVTMTVNDVDVDTTLVLAPIGDKQIREGRTLSFTLNATGGSDTIAYSAENLPAGAALSGDTFIWTPESGQAGSYEVTFIASDGQQEDSQTIIITVSRSRRFRWFRH